MKHRIPVLQPERIRNKAYVEKLQRLEPDLFVTCAYGQILSKAVLDIPKYGCINVHASLLPKYRGAAPIQRAVMNGDKITGITTMMTDIGMDTGDILLKSETEITEDMTSGELHDILKESGAGLLSDTLLRLSEGTLERFSQDDSEATHAPMLKKKESIIDWEENSKSIHDKVRALNPWPGCFTTYKEKRMRIIRTDYIEGEHNRQPGSISRLDSEMMEIACGTGSLRIYELQFENKKATDIAKCWHNIDEKAVLGGKD
jgi:methionyl-tRNA formyltransferase